MANLTGRVKDFLDFMQQSLPAPQYSAVQDAVEHSANSGELNAVENVDAYFGALLAQVTLPKADLK